jgi:6-pyruvoyl-tetrahydropterin synthase
MPAEPEVTVVRRLTFDAPRPAGSPHAYVLEVAVAGPLDGNGYVVDFDVLKRLMRDVVGRLAFPAPAERLAIACWRELEPQLRPRRLVRVTLWETPNQGADYHGD